MIASLEHDVAQVKLGTKDYLQGIDHFNLFIYYLTYSIILLDFLLEMKLYCHRLFEGFVIKKMPQKSSNKCSNYFDRELQSFSDLAT